MQVINLSFAGIYSNSNNLNDQTINGGLLKADNIVIDQPNVAKSRRGQKNIIHILKQKMVKKFQNLLDPWLHIDLHYLPLQMIPY